MRPLEKAWRLRAERPVPLTLMLPSAVKAGFAGTKAVAAKDALSINGYANLSRSKYFRKYKICHTGKENTNYLNRNVVRYTVYRGSYIAERVKKFCEVYYEQCRALNAGARLKPPHRPGVVAPSMELFLGEMKKRHVVFVRSVRGCSVDVA